MINLPKYYEILNFLLRQLASNFMNIMIRLKMQAKNYPLF